MYVRILHVYIIVTLVCPVCFLAIKLHFPYNTDTAIF